MLAVLQLLLVCRALGEHSLFPRQDPAGEGQCDHCQSYKIYIIVAVKKDGCRWNSDAVLCGIATVLKLHILIHQRWNREIVVLLFRGMARGELKPIN